MKDLNLVKDKISEYVTLGDILHKENFIKFYLDEEQLRCPFHGKDYKPSARYYKKTDSMYCWYCKRSWDLYRYLMERDGINFKQALNYIIKTYNVDLSGVPEVLDPERIKKKREERKKSSFNEKKLFLEKVFLAIKNLQDTIEPDKYKKLVYAYMVLKYSISDERYLDNAYKLNDALKKLYTKEI